MTLSTGVRDAQEAKWNETACELLSKLWKDGVAANEIASRIGGAINKMAVIGKARRLALGPHPFPQAWRGTKEAQAAKARKRRPKPALPRGSGKKQSTLTGMPMWTRGKWTADEEATSTPEVIQVDKLTVFAAIAGEGVRFEDVTFDHCRWPLGDPREDEFRFCGEVQARERPYCAAHCRIAYQPPEKRRKP